MGYPYNKFKKSLTQQFLFPIMIDAKQRSNIALQDSALIITWLCY